MALDIILRTKRKTRTHMTALPRPQRTCLRHLALTHSGLIPQQMTVPRLTTQNLPIRRNSKATNKGLACFLAHNLKQGDTVT